MSRKPLMIVRRINVTHFICDNLLGKDHSHGHRMGFGIILMGVGVYVSKLFGEIEFAVVHYATDVVGYAIHGLGLTPFVELLLEKASSGAGVTLDEQAREAVVYEDTH